MRARKGEAIQLFQSAPARSPNFSRKCGRLRCCESLQSDAVTSDRVIDGAEGLNLARLETEALPGPVSRDLRLSVRRFNVGKFPKIGVDSAWRTLPDEETSAVMNCKCQETPWKRFGLGRLARDLRNLVIPKGATELPAWTALALWLAGSADCGAELHERLIQIGAATLFGCLMVCGATNESMSQRPQSAFGPGFRRIGCDAKNPRQDAGDIAVQHRRRLVKSDAVDRTCGVTPDARQCDNLIELSRKISFVPGYDQAGGLVEVSRSRVVTETSPTPQNLGTLGASERAGCGESPHPSFPVWNDGLDLSLLKHDFGDPDGIGIFGPPPRQVAGILPVPGEQRSNKELKLNHVTCSRFAAVHGKFCRQRLSTAFAKSAPTKCSPVRKRIGECLTAS